MEVALVAILGRRDWQPGKTAEEDGIIRMSDKAVTSRVLPHDKLLSVLKGAIEARFCASWSCGTGIRRIL